MVRTTGKASYLRLFWTSALATLARPGGTTFDLKRLHRVKSLAGIIIILTAVPVGIGAAQTVQLSSEFELSNQVGVKKNPPDLKFELRTQDGKDTYHLYETIPLEMVFASSRPLVYSIAMNESMDWQAKKYRFEVDAEDAVIRYDIRYREGIVCCSYESLELSSKPVVLRKELTDFLRFGRAGTYQLFATTQRVFRNHGPANGEPTGTTVSLTSNLVTLNILPDDPEWDRERLTNALRILRDRKATDDYNRTMDDQSPWFRALKALSVLDTAEAIRERVAFGPLAEDNWPLRIALASSTRPDLMLAALEERGKDTSIALGDRFENAWTKFMIQRDCPDVFHWPVQKPGLGKGDDDFLACRTNAHQKLSLFLQSTLPTKTGAAKEVTAACIEWLKQGFGCPTGIPSPPTAAPKK